MKNKVIRSFLSICLLILMLLTTISTSSKAEQASSGTVETTQEAADVKSKSEVVYATLTANGSVKGIYVVNHYELAKAGRITDYGNYETVLNLTESKPIDKNEDMITIQTDTDNFYYQGNLESKELPWNFEITYDLDGAPMSPQELAGKSGVMGLHLKADNNEKIISDFFDNYMLQITVTLDADTCRNIEAPGATLADAGNNKLLAFTAMPGKGIDVEVKADVTNFTMKGIELSAVPFTMSFELDDTDELLAEFNQLPKAIQELKDGVGKLADGTSELWNGAQSLKGGSAEFNQGLTELEKNAKSITGASTKIKEALSLISSSLNNGLASEMDLTQLTQLPLGLTQLADGLEGISSGLKELQQGYTSAYSALSLAIQGIPDNQITEEELKSEFTSLTKEQEAILEELYEAYAAGQRVKATYNQVQQAFALVSPTIDTVTTNIDTIATTLDEISKGLSSSVTSLDVTKQLDQLTKGLSDLASNYESFDQGLKEYMTGVETIADGYSKFHLGLSDFSNGVGEVNSGVSELYNGTGQLNTEVSKMPDLIQEEIDKVMSDYDSSDFIPVSFVSPKNTHTKLVQFVLKCEGIEVAEVLPADTGMEQPRKETPWDRLLALFQ